MSGHRSSPGSGPCGVLVVEDDPDHVVLIEAAFRYGDFPCALHVVGSSEEAMDYFLGRYPFDNRLRHPLPDVVILEIGLPGMDGLGLLQWLQERDEPWARTPVVVFSSWHDREMARRAATLGALEFKVKPSDFADLAGAVRRALKRRRRYDIA